MSVLTATQITDASISVGASAALALTANQARQFLLIQNVHASQTVGVTFDGTTPVIGQKGTFTLTAAQAFLLDVFVPTGPINVIGSGSSTPVSIIWA